MRRYALPPHPTDRLDWLEAAVETRHGAVSCRWSKIPSGGWLYDIAVPVQAEIRLGSQVHIVPAGNYVFHQE